MAEFATSFPNDYLVYEQARETRSFEDRFKEDEVISLSFFLVKHLLEISVGLFFLSYVD